MSGANKSTNIRVQASVRTRLEKMSKECGIGVPDLNRIAIERLFDQYERDGYIVLGRGRPNATKKAGAK